MFDAFIERLSIQNPHYQQSRVVAVLGHQLDSVIGRKSFLEERNVLKYK